MNASRLLCFPLLWCAIGSYAQVPDRFMKAYGLEGDEYAPHVGQLLDGGYILAGTTYSSISAGPIDLYLVRTNAAGDAQWARSYGGPGDEWIAGMALTNDGGIVVAGYSRSWAAPDDTQPYLVKIDAAGDTVWSRTYGNEGRFTGLITTSDGGFILAGSRSPVPPGFPYESDLLIVRTDADGDTLWTRVLSDTLLFGTYMSHILMTADGDFVLGGYHLWSPWGPSVGLALMKMTAAGTVLWANTYQGSDGANDLWIAPDGNIHVLVNGSDFVNSYAEVYRIGPDGVPVDIRLYHPGVVGDWSMHVFDDGSYAFGGGNTIVRADAAGSALWAKEVTPGSHILQIYDVMVAADGDLVCTGMAIDTVDNTYEALLLKTEDGPYGCGMDTLTASSELVAGPSYDTLAMTVVAWAGPVHLVATQINSGAITTDLCIGSGVQEAATGSPLTVHLNGDVLAVTNAPSGDRYTLFDAMGRTVREGRVPAEQFTVPLQGLAPGVLTLRLSRTGQAKRFVWPGQ